MARAYPSFCSMKQLRVLLLSPGWDTSPLQGHPSSMLPVLIYIHLGGEEQWWQGPTLESPTFRSEV